MFRVRDGLSEFLNWWDYPLQCINLCLWFMGVGCYQRNLSKAVIIFFCLGEGRVQTYLMVVLILAIMEFTVSIKAWAVQLGVWVVTCCVPRLCFIFEQLSLHSCVFYAGFENGTLLACSVTIDIKHLDAGFFFQIVPKWSACRASEQPGDSFGKAYLPGRGRVMFILL